MSRKKAEFIFVVVFADSLVKGISRELNFADTEDQEILREFIYADNKFSYKKKRQPGIVRVPCFLFLR